MGGLLVGPAPAQAQPAPSAWTSTTLTTLPKGPDLDTLGAISCPRAGSCIAIGYSAALGEVTETLANGTWTTSVLPTPAGASGANLLDISCPSSTSCDAVGWSPPSYTPLLARLHQGVWTYTTPSITGSFSAISCAAPDTCTAIGSDAVQSQPGVNAYSVTGTAVVEQVLTPPSDLTNIGRAGASDISCATPTNCTAVGTAVSIDADEYSGDFPFAETLSGGTWTASDLPYGNSDFASSVSCPSVSTCYAIGQRQSKYGPAGGSSYAVKIAGGVMTTTNFGNAAQMGTVSCGDATHCVAFGTTDSSFVADTNLPASAVLSGGSWTVQTRSYPPGSRGTLAYLYGGIDCASATFCAAAGYLNADDYRNRFLVETFKSGGWSASEADTIPGQPTGGAAALSCRSGVSCVVVGTQVDTANRTRPMAEVLANGSWTRSTLPIPAGSAAGSLDAVSCAAAGTCTAVGQYFDGAGRQGLLADSLSHGVWKAHPIRVGFLSGYLETLTGIVCFSATSCVAAGYRVDPHSGHSLPFAVLLSGSTWTKVRLPRTGVLNGLACQSVTSCVAVGGSVAPSLRAVPEAWTLSGSTWTQHYLPHTYTTGSLTAVSCVAATACTAIGGGYSGFAETLQGATWSLVTLPNALLQAISCVAATSCTAVGQYANDPAVETLTASGWAEETLAAPQRGAGGSILAGVQCFSATTCIAAGTATNDDFPGAGRPFIEQR